MHVFDFRIVLERVDVSEEEASTIYANCKDGTLITEKGVTFVDFDRKGDSLEQAILTAIADVNAAGFRVARVELEVESLVAQTV